MITVEEINKAIVSTIKAGLPPPYDSVEFDSKDIKEGFSRPSFYLDFEDNTKSKASSERVERSVGVRIYYFPKDKNKSKLENIEVQDAIENILLEPLKINDCFVIEIEETESVITDGVLQVSFKLETREEYSRLDTSEFMETLEMELKG